MENRIKLYQELGLIGTIASTPTNKFVDYPTGEIDVSRVLDGRRDCFVEPVITNAMQKKKIIVTDCLYKYGSGKYSTEKYIKRLFKDGFEIYFWTGKLEHLKREEDIKPLLNQVEIIHRDAMAARLPELQLSSDECYILDTTRASNGYYLKMGYCIQDFDLDPVALKFKKLSPDTVKKILSTFADDPVLLKLPHRMDATMKAVYSEFMGQHKRIHINQKASKQLQGDEDSFPLLEKMVVYAKPYTDESLRAMLVNAKRLKSLTLEGDANLSGDFAKDLVHPQLESLCMTSGINISDEQLASWLSHNQPMKALNLYGCKNIKGDFIDKLSWQALKELRVSSPAFSSQDLHRLLSRTNALQQLSINDVYEMTGLSQQAVKLPDLQDLTMDSVYLTAPILGNLLADSAKLKKLRLHTYTKTKQVDHFAGTEFKQKLNLPNLQTFSVEGYPSFTMKYLNQVLANSPLLKDLSLESLNVSPESTVEMSLGNLEKLHIRNCNITDRQFLAMLQNAQKLKSMDLNGMHMTSDNIMKDIQLPSLKTLELKEIEGKKLKLAEFMHAAPKINTLNLTTCNFDFNLPEESEQNDIERLEIFRTNITWAQLTRLLSRSPHLNHLRLTQCDELSAWGNDSELAVMSELRYLSLPGNIYNSQLYDLLDHAPHLKTLGFSPASNQVDFKKWNIPEVEKLEVNRIYLAEQALEDLSVRAPQLQWLEMTGCNFGICNIGKLTGFKNLKNLNLKGSRISDHQLLALLKELPNLKTLNLSECRSLSTAFEKLASTKLETLYLEHLPIKAETIDALLQRCPNLKELHLFYSPVSDEQVSILKKKYPQLRIWHFMPRMGSQRSTCKVDGNFYYDDFQSGVSDPTVVNQVFHTETKYPDVADYRTQVFTGVALNAETGAVDFASPDGSHRIKVECDTNRKNLLTEFSGKDKAKQSSYVGETYYAYDTSAAEPVWSVLPNLDPNDKLIAIETIPHVDIDVCYDQDDSLYYIKPKQLGKNFHVTFAIEHHRGKEVVTDDADLNSNVKIQINKDGSLNVNAKLKALIDNMSYERKVSCLTSYMSFGDNKYIERDNQQTKKSDLEVINAILKNRVGACRHRAMAFMLAAKAVNVKARLVRNECHEYVEVWMHEKWVKIDLGGWDANLCVLPVRSDYQAAFDPADLPKPTLTASEDSDDDIAVSQANRFAVWNTYESNAATADEYVNELCLQANALQPGEKNILSVLNAAQIESVHAAFQRRAAMQGNHCYYVHHLDDIRESSYILDNHSGEFLKHDSEMVSYIKHAKPGDVLLVNWSDYESAHVGFNTMLDAERSLYGVPIPEGVTVVGLLDNKKTLGEDFYSRYRLVSDCPSRIANEPLVLQKNDSDQNRKLPEIIFYDNDWKQQWFGSYQIQNQSFQFINSAIYEAVAGNQQGVVLRNAPWHLPEFRLAVAELMTTRRLYINGRYLKIPDHFEFLRDDAPLSLSTGNYQLVKTEAEVSAPYILNMATRQQFYPGFTCRENGRLSQSAGLLAMHKGQTLSVLVTDNFSHAAWAKLLAEASKNKVKLILYCKRNTVLPAEMEKYSAISNTSPQKRRKVDNQFHASVISTNDIELECRKLLSQDKNVIRIPVNAMTTYADLIERIDVLDSHGKKLFKNNTSVLANYILAGKKIILIGDISPLLQRQLAPLFCSEPYLLLNGKQTSISSGSVTLITTQNNTEQYAVSERHAYDDSDRFSALSTHSNAELLKSACERFYALVPEYPHFTYVQLKTMLERMRALPNANPLTAFLRLDKSYSTLKSKAVLAWKEVVAGESWLKRRKLEKHEQDLHPIAKRLRKVMDELRSGPFVFVAGSSGIGKSRFVETDLLQEYPDINLFSGMDHIREWLAGNKRKTNILFIDEANLQLPGMFELFAGLMQKPPVILLDGKLHKIGEHQKIIFAGNFSHYKSRQQHDFFRNYGHVITFKEFPDSFMADNIIIPVMHECIPAMTKMNCEKYAEYYLRAYHHLNQLFPDTHPVTARNLQMMAMRTTRYLESGMIPGTAAALAVYDECCGMLNQSGRREFRRWLHETSHVNVDIKQEKHALKSHVNFNAPDFHLAKNRRNPVRQLDDLFALREMKLAKPGLTSIGTAGILFEGESGVGKSMMVKAYLMSHGFLPAESCDERVSGQRKFYHLTPTDPAKMKSVLVKAFHEGAVVIIDELNSLPLEHILNPLLSGVDPAGNKAQNPGFFVIGTQNPASFVKRQILSGALLNRVQNINLKDYGKADMLEIAEKHAPDNHDLKEMVNEFSAARLFAKSNHKMMPTLRHLIAAACKKI